MLAVRAAVAAPAPRQRAVVVRSYADLPVDEVAAALGCAPGTVKARTHKALANLRRAGLDDREEVPDRA